MIVFHTTKYGERSIILHGYTEESGRAGYLLRSTKKTGGRLLHPLSVIRCTLSEHTKGTLPVVREYVPEFPQNSIRSDIRKSTVAMFLGELLYRNLLLSEKDGILYSFLKEETERLENCEGNFANFHLRFLVGYISILGFPPEKGFQTEFDPFTEDQKAVVGALLEDSFEGAMQIPMNGNSRSLLLEALLRYIEYHTGTRLELKSLPVLHEIMKVI